MRVSPGATGGVGESAEGAEGGPSRASATRSISPAGTSVPDRLERGQHDPDGDDRQDDARGEGDGIAEPDRDDGRDRTLGGHDRRHDRHLADLERRVRQPQAADVTEPGEQQQRQRPGLEPLDRGSTNASGMPTMTPMSITQPSTTREPSIRLEREEARVAAAQSAAAMSPPRIAVTRASVTAARRVCGAAGTVGCPDRPVLPSAFAPGTHPVPRAVDHPIDQRGQPTLAKTPRTWTGARTPSGLKRVRQAQSRHEVLQPRRSAAKTYVAKALAVAAAPADSSIDANAALIDALSALDRAAKAGAIHPNAAARRKSRLTRKVNAALSGTTVQAGGHVTKSTGKLAAQKAAKARIAAGKAGKAKGAQTAAGKARAALSKTARAEAAAAKAAEANAAVVAAPTKAPATKAAAKPSKAKASASKATATKAAPKKAAATTAKAAPKATAKAAPKAKKAAADKK